MKVGKLESKNLYMHFIFSFFFVALHALLFLGLASVKRPIVLAH